MGWLFVTLIFCVPFIGWQLIRWIPEYFNFLKDFAKRKARLIALFYFFAAGATVSVSSSFYIERAKAANNASFTDKVAQVFQSLDDTGYYFLLFLPIVILVSFISDKFMELVSRYAFYHGGFTDPITRRENISLRFDTFVSFLSGMNNIHSVSEAIGSEFAAQIPSAAGNTSKDKLAASTKVWTEVDEKAGWCDSVVYDPIHDDLIVKNSFPIRIYKKNKQTDTNACDFLTGYVAGFVKGISAGALKTQKCDNTCGSGESYCRFKVA